MTRGPSLLWTLKRAAVRQVGDRHVEDSFDAKIEVKGCSFGGENGKGARSYEGMKQRTAFLT